VTAPRGIASWAFIIVGHQRLTSLKHDFNSHAALVKSGGMVRQRDASPAATEGLAAAAGGKQSK
jgi:hypothetical protein